MDLRRATAFFVSRGARLGELVVLAALVVLAVLAGRQDQKMQKKHFSAFFFGYTDKF